METHPDDAFFLMYICCMCFDRVDVDADTISISSEQVRLLEMFL